MADETEAGTVTGPDGREWHFGGRRPAILPGTLTVIFDTDAGARVVAQVRVEHGATLRAAYPPLWSVDEGVRRAAAEERGPLPVHYVELPALRLPAAGPYDPPIAAEQAEVNRAIEMAGDAVRADHGSPRAPSDA